MTKINRKHLLTPLATFILGITAFAIPLLWLFVAGLVSVFKEGYALPWLGCSIVAYVLGGFCWHHVRTGPRAMPDPDLQDRIGPEAFWSQRDLEIWQLVRAAADAVERGERTVKTQDELQALATELLRTVALAYNPRSVKPELEVKLADVLIVTEQASRDLRELFIESIPFHHIVTVHDVLRTKRGLEVGAGAFNFYRALRAVSSPVSAAVGEIRAVVSRRAFDKVSVTTSRWIVARIVEGAGKHLINLYSGQVVIPEELRAARPEEPSAAPDPAEQPVRILVAGQTGSGKSSLVNALLGEVRALPSPLPETDQVVFFDGYMDGIGKVLLIDSPGMEQPHAIRRMLRDAGDVDCVILTVPATSAARSPEAELLRELRRGAVVPPVVTAVTKIDRLSPADGWMPPYELEHPERMPDGGARRTAMLIREAADAIGTDLATDAIVPVAVERPDESYNTGAIHSALAGLLPEIRKLVLRRLLRHYKDDRYWEDLKRSLKNSGKLVARRGLESLIHGIRRFGDD